VDQARLILFPPLENSNQTQYEYDYSSNPHPAIAPSYAGVWGNTNAMTASGATLRFSTLRAFNSGALALVTDTTRPSVIPAGTYIQSVNPIPKTATLSQNVTGTGVASGDTIVVALPDRWIG
jgi:hypothetical protein